MNDGFNSLEKLKGALEMRCEIEFTLNGRSWLVEPDQDAPDLSSNLQLVCNDEGCFLWLEQCFIKVQYSHIIKRSKRIKHK